MNIDASGMHFQTLNERIRACTDAHIVIDRCLGQRYVASGARDVTIDIHGVPGNALGAYLDGAHINVYGNAQDAVGDTMNDGCITIHGSSGDATGYGMRGGSILIEGDVGYRAGIHMKAYRDKQPVMVIGGRAGSFLGEYQAGGCIVVLGLNSEGEVPVDAFCGTGMHGGHIYVRTDTPPADLPAQVMAKMATAEDLAAIDGPLTAYCEAFDADKQRILAHKFLVFSPNTQNPYKQLYTHI